MVIMRAHFNWKTAILVVICLAILLRLGFWQLQRADEKRHIMADIQARMSQPAVPYESLPVNKIDNYRNVHVTASFLPHYVLLDNQVYQGRFGYEVVQAAQLPSGQVLWVSRGWIAGDASRRALPQVKTPQGRQNLSGYLYQPTRPLQLAESEQSGQWPRVVQSLELQKLYKQIDKTAKIAPSFLLRLDPQSPAALTRHWQLVNVQPAKHTGYAVQWFGMAVVLVIVYLAAGFRRATPGKVSSDEQH